MLPISMEDINQAAERLQGQVKKTPVMTCSALDRITGARLLFKCENFQKAGAFKFRGASNAVCQLDPETAQRGVCTHSSGNHAAALALAASMRDIPAFVVMPETAPRVKVAAVREYGADIRFCEPTLAAREATLTQVKSETGATFIHPYNDPRVMAGQGTAALELLAEVGELDAVLAPVGGGGLLSGTAVAATGTCAGIQVIGAEPERADDAFRSFREGVLVPSVDPDTIADGLLTSLGPLTFAVIREQVDDIVTVSEEAIVRSMRLVWERMKIIIEPSSAVPLAAVLSVPERFRGKRVGIILSGGNVDLERVPWFPGRTGS